MGGWGGCPAEPGKVPTVSYGFAVKAVDETGKLVGGWLKSGGSKARSGTGSRHSERTGVPEHPGSVREIGGSP